MIAEGGFGVVYLGAQLALNRRVAIKVLKTPSRACAVGRILGVGGRGEEAAQALLEQKILPAWKAITPA